MTDKYNGERVAVIPRADLETDGPLFQGFAKPAALIAKLRDASVLRTELRCEMEQDAGFKQLIPYVVHWRAYTLTHDTHLIEFLSYVRGSGGGEARLHAKVSYGIGGHINLGDLTYEAALCREMAEEIEITTVHPTPCATPAYVPDDYPVVGLVNDDSTLVGLVHIGVVHLVRLPWTALVKSKEEGALQELRFRAVGGIIAGDMESWTELTIKPLTAMVLNILNGVSENEE